jgi:hypothetical protein
MLDRGNELAEDRRVAFHDAVTNDTTKRIEALA